MYTPSHGQFWRLQVVLNTVEDRLPLAGGHVEGFQERGQLLTAGQDVPAQDRWAVERGTRCPSAPVARSMALYEGWPARRLSRVNACPREGRDTDLPARRPRPARCGRAFSIAAAFHNFRAGPTATVAG